MRIAGAALLLDQNRPERSQIVQNTLARVHPATFDTSIAFFELLEVEVQRFASARIFREQWQEERG